MTEFVLESVSGLPQPIHIVCDVSIWMESRAEHVSPNIYGTEQLFGAQGIVELQFILVQGMVSQLFEGNLVTIHKHKPS